MSGGSDTAAAALGHRAAATATLPISIRRGAPLASRWATTAAAALRALFDRLNHTMTRFQECRTPAVPFCSFAKY